MPAHYITIRYGEYYYEIVVGVKIGEARRYHTEDDSIGKEVDLESLPIEVKLKLEEEYG